VTIADAPRRTAAFGSGGGEPYARALRDEDATVLYLELSRTDGTAGRSTLDLGRWNAGADLVDLRLLASVTGPVLDVGCGPGRMVRAAMDLGLEVLGVDVSRTAVELGRDRGLNVLERSIFDRLPAEGSWQTVLLVDENIGIGGDVELLLARCRDLLSPTGELVVELHADADRDRHYTGHLVDEHGARSASFPWAEIGLTSIRRRALRVGLVVRQSWSADGRSFCRLAKSFA
jgi:SAM-dependent methyltransferase